MNGREMLTLEQAAEHVHLTVSELRHIAQRGEVEAFVRGNTFVFPHRELDEWAQRNLLAVGLRELRLQHRVMMSEDRRTGRGSASLADLFRESAIDLDFAARAKGGVVRDMTSLAAATGLVNDEDGLYHELVARENAASTAVGEGAAFLHPRFHDPYFFESSFIAYARSGRGVFFGSADGRPTRHFFLVCSTEHEQHLHVLAGLALLAHGSDLLELLDAAETPAAAIAAVRACEAEYGK